MRADVQQLGGTVVPLRNHSRTVGPQDRNRYRIGEFVLRLLRAGRLRARRQVIVPVILFVMVLAFLLMLVAFRSVTIAAVSVLLNVLSMAAAFGVMVAVFQHGWGAGLVGGGDVGAIESWIPLFAFVILFGLSMDYHVFVVSRIREAHDRGLSTATPSRTASRSRPASSPARR